MFVHRLIFLPPFFREPVVLDPVDPISSSLFSFWNSCEFFFPDCKCHWPSCLVEVGVSGRRKCFSPPSSLTCLDCNWIVHNWSRLNEGKHHLKNWQIRNWEQKKGLSQPAIASHQMALSTIRLWASLPPFIFYYLFYHSFGRQNPEGLVSDTTVITSSYFSYSSSTNVYSSPTCLERDFVCRWHYFNLTWRTCNWSVSHASDRTGFYSIR